MLTIFGRYYGVEKEGMREVSRRQEFPRERRRGRCRQNQPNRINCLRLYVRMVRSPYLGLTEDLNTIGFTWAYHAFFSSS